MTTGTMFPGLVVEWAESMADSFEKRDLTAEEVPTAIAMCVFLQGLFARARRSIEWGLSQGVDAKAFADKYEPAVTALEMALTTTQRVLTKARTNPLAPATDQFVSSYRALMDDMLSLHKFLAEAVAKAKMPARPIDWNRVKEAEAAYARGETKPFQQSTKS